MSLLRSCTQNDDYDDVIAKSIWESLYIMYENDFRWQLISQS